MTLPKDPFILLSMINMKLRDEFDSLDELVASLDIDREELSKRLKEAGFNYYPALNQFR